MTNLIRLIEIVKDGDGTRSRQMLLNPDFISSVTTGQLKQGEQSGLHLIGKTKVTDVTFISFKNGQGTFVEETLGDIERLIFLANGSVPEVTTG